MPGSESNVSINLLQKTDLEHTAIGRITTWAVTYGRYIMIGTEIVVLLAFIARFSLDRKLTDLKEEIAQKQAILVANAGFEQDVRNIQERLTKIKTVTSAQTKPIDILVFLQNNTPVDISLVALDYSNDKLIIEAISGSTDGFSQFLTSLALAPGVRNLDIGDIQKQPGRGIQFKISLSIAAPTPVPGKK